MLWGMSMYARIKKVYPGLPGRGLVYLWVNLSYSTSPLLSKIIRLGRHHRCRGRVTKAARWRYEQAPGGAIRANYSLIAREGVGRGMCIAWVDM